MHDEYLVMCVREIEDKGSRYGKRYVNVLIYPSDWEDIEIEPDQYPTDHRNYQGKTDDHPKNDMLPPIENDELKEHLVNLQVSRKLKQF